jgi:hypothetical protein
MGEESPLMPAFFSALGKTYLPYFVSDSGRCEYRRDVLRDTGMTRLLLSLKSSSPPPIVKPMLQMTKCTKNQPREPRPSWPPAWLALGPPGSRADTSPSRRENKPDDTTSERREGLATGTVDRRWSTLLGAIIPESGAGPAPAPRGPPLPRPGPPARCRSSQ